MECPCCSGSGIIGLKGKRVILIKDTIQLEHMLTQMIAFALQRSYYWFAHDAVINPNDIPDNIVLAIMCPRPTHTSLQDLSQVKTDIIILVWDLGADIPTNIRIIADIVWENGEILTREQKQREAHHEFLPC